MTKKAISKAVRVWRYAAQVARTALVVALAMVDLVIPPFVAGLVALLAHAATTTFLVNTTGDFTFTPSARVPAQQTITATATDTSTHDTCEFSAPRTVVAS